MGEVQENVSRPVLARAIEVHFTDITYVLIHSPLVGPLTWGLVQAEMARRDLQAITPTLLDHPGTGLPYWRQHADSLANSLKQVSPDRKICLIAHSGAGPLLPVMRQPIAHSIAAYVFVDAGIPRADSSRLDLMRQQDPEWAEQFHQELLQGGRFPTWTEQDLLEEIPDDDLRRKMAMEVNPRSLSFFIEPLPVFSTWPDAPCAYIKFSASYDWDFNQAKRAGWYLRELNAGHFHMLVDPALVADMIIDAVQNISQSRARCGGQNNLMTENVGILHPGEMGVSIAASAKNSGQNVLWVSEGRSPDTYARAESHSLTDAHTLKELCQTCSILISVCPPHATEEVARQVLAQSFKGLYVDANAVSPQRVIQISEALANGGITFVDGSIIGGPAWQAGTTWLYLSGREAQRVANCFHAGPLETEVIGERIGKASALKMCYAAYTKGMSALLCAILGTAENLGVRPELERQWSHGGSDFSDQTIQRVRRVTAKAWRFAGEMDEIAATFEAAGMPGGFQHAASEVYQRLARFKGQAETPSLTEVLEALNGNGKKLK